MAYKFYWIKLMQDFYEQKEIKKMRTMPAGDTLVIIYQRMQLLSLKNNGVIAYEGIEEDLAAELALQLSENINTYPSFCVQTRLPVASSILPFSSTEYGIGNHLR